MLNVVMLSVIMQSVVMLSVIVLNVVMLSVIMLSVVILSVVMLSVVMLSVTASYKVCVERIIYAASLRKLWDTLKKFCEEETNFFSGKNYKLFFALIWYHCAVS